MGKIPRRAIREAVMTSTAGGQDIVEELDALALLASPRSGDGPGGVRAHNPMSPASTDWSRALGWAGPPPFHEPERVSDAPFAERPNSPPPVPAAATLHS